MSGTFLFGVFTLTIACASAFMHPFLWEELPIPAAPNASRRFQLPALRSFSDDVGVPWGTFRNTPVHSRITQAEIRTQRVENMMVDLLSTLLHADDCALVERQAQGMGAVYLDSGFNMSRPPFLLRSGVRDIMGKYSVPLRPLERKWTVVGSNESRLHV
jgi:hypothetical protein